VRKKAAARGEEDEGRSRATKPSTPRLAAMEASEQAQKLRVVGEELIGVGEGGCRREGEPRDGLGVTVGGGGDAAAAGSMAEVVTSGGRRR
jgi:hypothetical protein